MGKRRERWLDHPYLEIRATANGCQQLNRLGLAGKLPVHGLWMVDNGVWSSPKEDRQSTSVCLKKDSGVDVCPLMPNHYNYGAVGNLLGGRRKLAEGIGSLLGWRKGVRQKKTKTRWKIVEVSQKACRELGRP
ncbi:hypothetical protein B296_00019618 [Ensete ventricosum]|uniref:Uncharacterized protein n=1 Tax=Ensete ventricosum TaxID=4639 RepID=A0A426YF13_ENSVE|nr:hypothetical protein B296_00019618 [Ensete ventricosum]